MNFSLKNLLSIAAVTAATLSCAAEQVAVNPTPQSVRWGDRIVAIPSSARLSGASDADRDAVAALRRVIPDGGKYRITIGERGDKAVKAFASKIPDKAEGYYLSVTPKEIVIAGNDPKGTFYGVQTLLQLIAGSKGELTEVEITDWPGSSNRGVVEGFYGNPWSQRDRLRQFDFYGANKLDTYIYGPKDDPYHHSRWREPYPADKAAQLKEMAEAAARNKVWFVWAMHPGNSIKTDEDRAAAVEKLEQMYDMGFRSFAIFFDDISNYDASLQADYLNFLTDNFVRKHEDVTPLIMCPSEYNKLWAGDHDYLPILGSETYPEIRIMWTGNSVVDMIDVADIEWIESRIGRKPFIWLNWPVNDYCVDHLLMGPLYGNDKEVPAMTSGFVLNPMEYAEASTVSIFSGADYLWNPDSYNPEESWERAVAAIAPANREAFRTFCTYNVDLGQNTHRLRRLEETPELKALIDSYGEMFARGESPEGETAIREEFLRAGAAADELLATADTMALTAEIRPWIEVMKLLAERGCRVVDMRRALTVGDSVAFVNAYTDYAALTDKASRVESRNFEGTIKSANPVVGSLYAEPFLRQNVADMTADYRHNYGYRLDLFPNPAVENGVYRIVDEEGRYLGNPDAGSTGGHPVWQSAEDDVNPDRQLWRISMDLSTDRYQIVNAKDRRYLNEHGAFTQSETWNPYNPEWHSYVIERDPDGSGLFAIRNAGRSGSAYWFPEGDRIVVREPAAGESPYRFRLVAK
ncbi:MAG: beta-N-acetylglucosaminidase domain-containing protein [Clostridium sp.]|nr:beta-N-acetylglucosaminidase domain-containing protein [Clostridium sp.]